MFYRFNVDEQLMRMAIKRAKRGLGNVSPNPLVGCVIMGSDGKVSTGYHQFRGSNHAEVNAIINADKTKLDGATLYCTLEPCCHRNKMTPPCVDLIKKYKFKKIVIGALDPNPEVSGKGVDELREAGYEVVTGVLKEECEQLNKIFNKNMNEGMPYILLKSAITLDGKIANAENQSQWITDRHARDYAHVLRKEMGAVMIGRGTLEKDDPKLTIRRVYSQRGVTRILVANVSKLEKKPSEYKLFKDQIKNPTIVITGEENINSSQVNELKDMGVQLVFRKSGPIGPQVFSGLYELGVRSILVEGGAQLMSSLVNTGNYDELGLFVAPFMIGNGKSFYDNPEILDINAIPRMRLDETKKIGDQIYISYLRKD